MISKYPPIEGGESSKCYWLMRGLGARGHEIHVVTNAMETEDEFREQFASEDLDCYQPQGVHVHNTDPFSNPHHIPFSKPYAEKLANTALEIVRRYDTEIIDSWYILPYGISGFIVKTLSGKPQVLRHAGSDLTFLLQSPSLNTLFTELFKRVDTIVTYPKYRELFSSRGVSEDNLFLNTRVSVDTEAFNPTVEPLDLTQFAPELQGALPVITFLGKLGTTKGIYDLVEALEGIRADFRFVIVTGGQGIEKLKNRIKTSTLAQKTLLLRFIPPWRVPSLMRASTCVVHPERDFPVVTHMPILPREVMATGTCLMISHELYAKRSSDKIQDGESVIVINPKDTEGFRSKLEWIINNPESAIKIGLEGRIISEGIEDFGGYLDSMERLYSRFVTD